LLIFYLQLRVFKLCKNTIDSVVKIHCIAVFIVFLLQAGSLLKPLIFTNRFDANFFHPNVLGILFCAILIYFHENKEKHKLYYLLSIILLLFSFSKTGYIIYCAYLLIKFFSSKKHLCFILFAYFFFSWNNQNTLSKFRNQIGQAIQIKTEIYQATFKGIGQQPLGHGTGLYAYKVQQYLSNSFQKLFPNPNHHSLYRAHNLVLEYSFESGLLMMLLLFYSIFYLSSFPSNPIKSCLIFLTLASLFSMHLNYPESQIFFVFLLSYLESERENYL
ncbi:hypothetical protein MJH12_09000, partial [bacterium]|nr:hypothetical protein [bacterium]